MESETHKLIGGPRDGDYIAVPRTTHYIDIAVMDPLPAGFWNDPKPDMMASYHTVTYQRSKLAGSTKTFVVWTPSNWDGDRLIEELIRRA